MPYHQPLFTSEAVDQLRASWRVHEQTDKPSRQRNAVEAYQTTKIVADPVTVEIRREGDTVEIVHPDVADRQSTQDDRDDRMILAGLYVLAAGMGLLLATGFCYLCGWLP